MCGVNELEPAMDGCPLDMQSQGNCTLTIGRKKKNIGIALYLAYMPIFVGSGPSKCIGLLLRVDTYIQYLIKH